LISAHAQHRLVTRIGQRRLELRQARAQEGETLAASATRYALDFPLPGPTGRCGPLVATAKITGRYVNGQGQALCRYESRLSVLRNQPAVHIYFTLDWNQNDDVAARDVGLRLPAGFTGTSCATEGLPNQPLPPRTATSCSWTRPERCSAERDRPEVSEVIEAAL